MICLEKNLGYNLYTFLVCANDIYAYNFIKIETPPNYLIKSPPVIIYISFTTSKGNIILSWNSYHTSCVSLQLSNMSTHDNSSVETNELCPNRGWKNIDLNGCSIRISWENLRL